MDKLDVLREKGLPMPLRECNYCDDFIFLQDNWFQCPTCGCRTTAYGGDFPSLPYNGKTYGASQEWIDLCNKSKALLDNSK